MLQTLQIQNSTSIIRTKIRIWFYALCDCFWILLW